jgi:hypothetical protein
LRPRARVYLVRLFLGWKLRLASGIVLLRVLHFIDLSLYLSDSHGRNDKPGAEANAVEGAVKLTMNV